MTSFDESMNGKGLAALEENFDYCNNPAHYIALAERHNTGQTTNNSLLITCYRKVNNRH